MPNDEKDVSSPELTDQSGSERGKGGSPKHYTPQNNMAIAGVARRYVRRMINQLVRIAEDVEIAASPRVSAAKAVIEFSRLKAEDVKNLSNEEIATLARKIINARSNNPEDAKQLKAAAAPKIH